MQERSKVCSALHRTTNYASVIPTTQTKLFYFISMSKGYFKESCASSDNVMQCYRDEHCVRSISLCVN